MPREKKRNNKIKEKWGGGGKINVEAWGVEERAACA